MSECSAARRRWPLHSAGAEAPGATSWLGDDEAQLMQSPSSPPDDHVATSTFRRESRSSTTCHPLPPAAHPDEGRDEPACTSSSGRAAISRGRRRSRSPRRTARLEDVPAGALAKRWRGDAVGSQNWPRLAGSRGLPAGSGRGRTRRLP